MNQDDHTGTAPAASRFVEWGLLALSALVLGWHANRYDFVCDDAYISLRYARNLANHGELVFNLGERVEGITNLLWTVLIAGGIKLGFLPENVARLLGWMSGVGTLIVVPQLVRAMAQERRHWADASGAVVLAVSAGFACWASGGLETQLYGFLLTLGLLMWLKGAYGKAGLILGIAAAARPEALLVAALLGIARRVQLGYQSRRIWLVAEEVRYGGGLLLTVAPVFIARFFYYGWLFPNTYYAKTRATEDPELAAAVLAQGFHYAQLWLWQSGTVLLLPFLALAVWHKPRRALIGLSLLAVHTAWVIHVGGDFLGLHRFFVPWMAIVTATAVVGLRYAMQYLPAKTPVLRPALLILLVGLFASTQMTETATALSTGAKSGIESALHTRGMAIERGRMGLALADHMQPGDYSVFDAAGAQPFYGHIRGVDRYGLLWPAVAHHDPVVNARPGHQVMAPLQRILRLRPTFLLFCARIHRIGRHPALCPDEAAYLRAGYERVGVRFQNLRGFPRVYAFLKRKDRAWKGLRP